MSMNGNDFDIYLVSFIIMAFMSMMACLAIFFTLIYNKKLMKS